jgi:hypothetical protein
VAALSKELNATEPTSPAGTLGHLVTAAEAVLVRVCVAAAKVNSIVSVQRRSVSTPGPILHSSEVLVLAYCDLW